MKKNWKLGLTFALTTVVMWGLLPLALKGLLSVMDVMTITWYRFSVSAALALLWYGNSSKRSLLRLFSSPAIMLTALAISSLLCNYYLYLTGLSQTTASAAQIIIQLAPLLLLLGSVTIFKESFSLKQWLGVVAFSIGFILFFHHRIDILMDTSSIYLKGTISVVIAAICWAIYGLAQKQLIKKESSNSLLLAIYIAGSIVFLPAASPEQALQLTHIEWGLLAFVSLNTIVAYNAFGLAMTHWDTTRVSAILTLTPLLTMIFAQLVTIWLPEYMETEPLDALSWIGALLIIIGSSAAALLKSKSKLDTTPSYRQNTRLSK